MDQDHDDVMLVESILKRYLDLDIPTVVQDADDDV
jgi:hypothetical protein